jgi:hypothetical protein
MPRLAVNYFKKTVRFLEVFTLLLQAHSQRGSGVWDSNPHQNLEPHQRLAQLYTNNSVICHMHYLAKKYTILMPQNPQNATFTRQKIKNFYGEEGTSIPFAPEVPTLQHQCRRNEHQKRTPSACTCTESAMGGGGRKKTCSSTWAQKSCNGPYCITSVR